MTGSAPAPGKDAIQFDEAFILKVEDDGNQHAAVITILEDLYRIRAASYIRYLIEWRPYTNQSTIRLRNLMVKTSQANEAAIVELIELLETFGATPRSAMFGMGAADTNYTDWKNLLPRLIASQQNTVAGTENALAMIVGSTGEEQVRSTLAAQLTADQAALTAMNENAATLAVG